MFTPQRSREYQSTFINMQTPQTPHLHDKHDNSKSKTSSTPLGTMSPVVDALKSVRRNATREFDRLYGSMSEWTNLSPRRTDQHRVIKHTPRTTERFRDTLKRTSLTPMMAQHSLINLHRDLRSPARYERQSPLGRSLNAVTPSMEPSARQFVITPNTMASSVEADNQYLDKNPRRAQRRSILDSPSLCDQLETEISRMEKLQQSLHKIKRQSSTLAAPSPSHDYTGFDNNLQNTTFTSPKQANTYISSRETYSPITRRITNDRTPSRQQNDSPQPMPLTSHRTPTRTAGQPTSAMTKNEGPSQEDFLHDINKSIPKAKLRSTKVIHTPNGSQVQNRFWDEIHGSSQLQPSPSNASRSSPLAQRAVRRAASSHQRPAPSEDLDEDQFWSSDIPRTSFNDRLRCAVEEEREEHEQQITLGQELDIAHSRLAESQLATDREKIANDSFALTPIEHEQPRSSLFAELRSKFQEKHNATQIDGDEWTFSGKQYLLTEHRT